MARKTIEQRLGGLEAQRSALKARLSKQERANDTRRKVLLGAFVLHRLENSKDDDELASHFRQLLTRELPGFLTRDNDKTLFSDLISKSANSASANTAGEMTS